MSNSNPDPVAHALRYPFDPPTESYVFQGGRARPMDRNLDIDDRMPVIASGSNASPTRLAEKFGHDGDTVIPVETATLSGHVAAYSAHVARYGSIAATLHPQTDAEAAVHVTWLTPEQCERMHETEAIGLNYGFYRLKGLTLQTGTGRTLDNAYAYISLRGTLHVADRPATLDRWPQPAIVDHFRQKLAPTLSLEAFVGRLLEDPDYRRTATEALAVYARLFPGETIERLL